jgi:ribosomal protein S18 acetylase RimI-like enzyme
MTDSITVFAPSDLAELRALLLEYGDTLDVKDRCFQDFDGEIDGLPGDYVPPDGALLVARDAQGEVVGCVALHRMDADACEMKRLYVRPSGQGRGLGRRLAEALIGQARSLGYRAVRLDTLEHMKAAQALYATLGFREIAPFNTNPTPGITFLELDLQEA